MYKKSFTLLLLAVLPARAAPPPGALVPGTLDDGTGEAVIDATHTAFCMINPSIGGTEGAQTFFTLGPSDTVFQQNQSSGPVVVTFPGLAEGELIVQNGQTQASYYYFSRGTAILSFVTATTGTIAFIGSGNTLPNPNINPTFNSYATSFNASNNRLYVSFGIIMGPCSVAFRGAFQT
jgi:hypothetical protein